jgi:hypothetical protein
MEIIINHTLNTFCPFIHNPETPQPGRGIIPELLWSSLTLGVKWYREIVIVWYVWPYLIALVKTGVNRQVHGSLSEA